MSDACRRGLSLADERMLQLERAIVWVASDVLRLVLLDTHAFLWWVKDVPTLSKKARTAIGDPGNECLLSLASCWEMAIKLSLGKLRLPSAIERFIPEQLAANAFRQLAIASAMLPGLRHCRFITAIRSTVCSLRRPSRSVV